MDMNVKKFFAASYLSRADIDDGQLDYVINVEAIWADNTEDAIGVLESDSDFAHKRPWDINGLQMVQISTELAEEIIAQGSSLKIKKLFVASYLSYVNIGWNTLDYTINVETIWAESPEEVVGILESHHDFKNKRPIDLGGLQIIEIGQDISEEIISRSPMF